MQRHARTRRYWGTRGAQVRAAPDRAIHIEHRHLQHGIRDRSGIRAGRGDTTHETQTGTARQCILFRW